MGEPDLVAAVAEAAGDAAPEIRPYPGLRPFREDESHLFFGRESHRREVLRRLVASRFVAVVGTSGSGKSSLIRAGLFPDLCSGYLPRAGSDWVVVETSPGNDPIGRLAARFAAVGWPVTPDDLRTNSTQILESAAERLEPGQQLLVLIDQFEELFRLAARDQPVADHDEKACFVRLLLQAGGQAGGDGDPRVHVVIAMRSEFLGRASTFRGLPEAIDQGQYLIPRLTREELRKAIVCPAHVASGDVEEALVQRLLNELGDGDDQLPVLQHALMRSWDICRRAGKETLDHRSYEDSGGLNDALSNDASEVLEEATKAVGPDAERIVKRVFQSLRATDVNGGQTRRPTTVADLCEIAGCSRDTLERAIDPFRARSFLLPPPGVTLQDETLIDVSHEALLRRWTTLGKWIEEDELHRRLYLRIAGRAADEEGSSSPDYFVMPLLGVLEKFWSERQPTRAWAVRHHPGFDVAGRFLAASTQHQHLEDAKANRRVRLRLAVAVLAVIVIVAGGLLWRLSRSNAALDAQSRILEAEVVASRAATTPPSDIETRTQLAADALSRRSTPEAHVLLLQSLSLLAKPLREQPWAVSSDDTSSSPMLSEDGSVLFAVDASSLRAIDVATNAERWSAARPAPGGLTLLRAADTRLVALSNDTAYVIDARDGRSISASVIHQLVAGTVSGDGTTAAFVTRNRELYLCTLARDCRDLRSVGRTAFDPADVALIYSGRRAVVVGAEDGAYSRTVGVFDLAPFRKVAEQAVEATGSLLAVSIDALDVRLCGTSRFTSYGIFSGNLRERQTVSFPREASECVISGTEAATVHRDGAVRIWNSEGDQIATVSTRGDAAARITFAGSRLAAVGARLRVWDTTRYGRMREFRRDTARLLGDGRHVLDGGSLFDIDTGRERLIGRAMRDALARLMEIGGSSQAVWLIQSQDLRTQELMLAEAGAGFDDPKWKWRVPAPPGMVAYPSSVSLSSSVSFSADGRRLSVETKGSPTTILDATTGATIRHIDGASAAFVSGRSEVLARAPTSTFDLRGAPLQVWPLPDGEPRALATSDPSLAGNRAGVFAISPDGKLLAVAERLNIIEAFRTGEEQRTWKVGVWDWPSLALRQTFAHTAPVTALKFRGDSRALLTVTPDDSAIHAWDLATGSEFARVPTAPQSSSPSMQFTPEGRFAFVDSAGLTVLPLAPAEWVREACARLSRNLTRDEWAQVVGENVEYTRTCPSRP